MKYSESRFTVWLVIVANTEASKSEGDGETAHERKPEGKGEDGVVKWYFLCIVGWRKTKSDDSAENKWVPWRK